MEQLKNILVMIQLLQRSNRLMTEVSVVVYVFEHAFQGI